MGRLQNGMAGEINQGELLLRRAAPEDKDNGAGEGADGPDHRIGERLPPFFLMGCGGMGANGQDGVQQQDSLFRPVVEGAAVGNGDVQIRIHLLEDVAERGGEWHAVAHREGQTVRLTVVMIGVLTENQDPDCIGRRQTERPEQVLFRGENLLLRILFRQEIGKAAERLRLKRGPQHVPPFRGQHGLQVHSFTISPTSRMAPRYASIGLYFSGFLS